MKRYLVTGGAGFIGSAVVRHLIGQTQHQVLVVDKLTYAGNRDNLKPVADDPRLSFLQADIGDQAAMRRAFAEFAPDIVMHLAAESHVDRSITGSAAFMTTNVIGTHTMLEAARGYWSSLGEAARGAFRFLHVSTDEVYGTLAPNEYFVETTAYDPRSPYSASKAAADHLASAWHHTYGLPVVTTNCSNNYGPRHFPEKLIPLIVLNALEGKPLPVYGDGRQERDWLYVDDHVRALVAAAERGRVGETYNIGGREPRRNLDVVFRICDLLDGLRPLNGGSIDRRRQLVRFVADRPGHDRRYAIDCSKAEGELGWRAQETFETGIEKTVRWYLDNETWWRPLRERVYAGERLGLLGGKPST